MADPDWTDPCAVLTWLRPRYFKAMTDGGVIEVRHGDELNRYSAVNMNELRALMQQLEQQCNRAQGLSRRRAITAG